MQLEREALKALIRESIQNLSEGGLGAETALEKAVAAGGGDPNKPTAPSDDKGQEGPTLAKGAGASQANSLVSKLKILIPKSAAKSDYERVMKLDVVGRINALALFGDEVLQIPKEELIANLTKVGAAARAQSQET